MNQDIFWFEIPVLHSLRVHLIQTNCNICDNLVDLGHSEGNVVFGSLFNKRVKVALICQI